MRPSKGSDKRTRFTTGLGVLCLATALGCSDAAESNAAELADGATEQSHVDARSTTDASLLGVPVLVHRELSELTSDQLRAVLDAVNAIWAPATICFEFDVSDTARVSDTALDLFFTTATIPDSPSSNGVYRSPDDIWTIDQPALGPAPNPADIPAARTAAHELGHALGLPHQNCGSECPCEVPDGQPCDDFLMRSGTLGFRISNPEVTTARAFARQLGDPVTSCALRFRTP